MKKKYLYLSLIFSLTLTLSACGKSTSTSSTNSTNTNSTLNSSSSDITVVNKDNTTKDTSTKVNENKNDTKNEQIKKEEPKTVETKKEVSKNTAEPENKKVTANKSSSNLNTKERDWFYEPRTDGKPSGEPKDVLDLINKYSAYYVGDTSQKIIYLTFDEGYENGYSSQILDILKANNVKAAFFVTTPYINENKELIKRMVKEGHVVGNHSTTHPSMAATATQSQEKFNKEFADCENAFEKVTGTKMPKFFRPPMGKYSELSLSYTEKLGYKTIFWSFAYADWDPQKQPSHEDANKMIKSRTHGGGIYLLHAVSKTNTEILDSLIKDWKSKGYEFKSLNELPQK